MLAQGVALLNRRRMRAQNAKEKGKKDTEAERQSPVLVETGSSKECGARRIGKVAREHPRYERAKLEIGPREIIRTVARMYRVVEAEVLSGNR
jgi:hypothetical protein